MLTLSERTTMTMLERSDLELETVFRHPFLEAACGYSKEFSYDGNYHTGAILSKTVYSP